MTGDKAESRDNLNNVDEFVKCDASCSLRKRESEDCSCSYACIAFYTLQKRKTEYEKRYTFSNYLLDPLKHRFRTVVRVLALVFLFVSKLRKSIRAKNEIYNTEAICNPDFMQNQSDRYIVTTGFHHINDPLKCAGGLVVVLQEDIINLALQYYYLKATAEIFEFVEKKRYEKIAVAKDGILYYSGRILSTQKFGGDTSLCDAAFDLTSTTFCVPLSDGYSPIARAIVNEIHWYDFDVKHGGVESVLKQVQRVCHIIGGR